MTDFRTGPATQLTAHWWIKIGKHSRQLEESNDLIAPVHVRSSLTDDEIRTKAEGLEAKWSEMAEAARQVATEKHAEREMAEAIERVQETLATPKQVDYIMTLLRKHEGGGYMTGPTTREGVAALDRQTASAYIDSLKGEY